jgi:hypothetical protein|tara:strand:- start:446 stop:832 length:387 start_codon:yes stop_codon:yes gene_type:complete
MIKDIPIEKLRNYAVDILSKSFFELGQNPDEDTIVSMALTLAQDLKEDFPNLCISDIQQSFRNGIRRSDEFHISVRTYYKWIKQHRQIIWDNETVEEKYKDKRLSYRNPGMKSLNNSIKQLKILKNGK